MTAELTRDFAFCRKIALGHYENFPVGSILIPKPIRSHFYSLYAFMRTADDFADEPHRPNEERLTLLADWRSQLHDIFTGEALNNPIFRALRETVIQFRLPEHPLARLLDAFEFDARGDVHFDTFEDIHHYTSCSAEPVGQLVLALFGYTDPERIQRSNQICTALQINNFFQDAKADLENGRCYFPKEDYASIGITDWHDLLNPETERLAVLTGLERVKTMLRNGAALPEYVSGRLRFELRAVLLEAWALISMIESKAGDTITSRPAIGGTRHVAILLRSLLGPVRK